MGEKKEGKEKEKCSTMPDVLIKGYKILRTVSVGQDFSHYVKDCGMVEKKRAKRIKNVLQCPMC